MEKNNKSMSNAEENPYESTGSFIWELFKILCLALIIVSLIKLFLFQPFFVQGASMEPNFKDGDYLIVNELGYKQTNLEINNKNLFTVGSFADLSRGDVVVFRYPKDPKQFFIKRIVGLPGEKVKIENGKVTIFNEQQPEGVVLDEKAYLSVPMIVTNATTIQLSDEEYFVLGDNRQASHDSRAWGPLPKKNVIGKVLIRAWPLSKAEIL